MLELQGKFGTAKVFTDVVDNESISQVINLLNQPYIEGSKVRMMPDIHAGAGCTIGTTMTIKDKICPNLVGVDTRMRHGNHPYQRNVYRTTEAGQSYSRRGSVRF